DAADFTRAIPVTILIMLATSYAFALLVSPLLAERVLKPRTRGAERSRMARFGTRIGAFAVHHGAWVIGAGLVLVGLAGLASRHVDRDFFPTTDRNQLVVDVYHAEGTPAEATAKTVLELGEELDARPSVQRVYQFAGSSGPRFYYNLNENPRAPHVGRVVLETGSADDLEPLIDYVRDEASLRWPGAQLVARRLAQGPPAPAPVELRVLGQDRAALAQAAETLTRLLRDIPGTADVRHNLGVGIPSLRFEIDDALADSRGLDRERVARALAMQTQGVQVGTYRAGEDPVPIVLRSPQGVDFDLEQLVAVNAYAADRRAVPVMDTGQGALEWQPAVIHHWDLQPAVTVLSELEEGVTYAGVYERLFERLDETGLPPGIEIQAGGYQESSGEANTALYRTLPLGMLLLLFFLLLQFNSFRRVGIVLVTVPLAIVGVVPGLLLTGYAFGFMALLGVIALVGIVVNNAIVLIDVVDAQLAEGASIEQSVIAAVARRTRPILLTTVTTVAGLLPLTFADSTLWPPMAWSIISGLILSTLLTLGVVPALCRWLLRPA
ncbi:MAG: efflux RND transporter permease subunit, partial [Xanthomonadales bacterium]|nr:efflux RND transporter permease subunit [Xanthomonadales bacterium]